jgi:hypothetical protein
MFIFLFCSNDAFKRKEKINVQEYLLIKIKLHLKFELIFN